MLNIKSWKDHCASLLNICLRLTGFNNPRPLSSSSLANTPGSNPRAPFFPSSSSPALRRVPVTAPAVALALHLRRTATAPAVAGVFLPLASAAKEEFHQPLFSCVLVVSGKCYPSILLLGCHLLTGDLPAGFFFWSCDHRQLGGFLHLGFFSIHR